MPQTKEFIKLKEVVKGEYFGKKVPKKYQGKYGKVYGLKDVKSLAFAIAKSKRLRFIKFNYEVFNYKVVNKTYI